MNAIGRLVKAIAYPPDSVGADGGDSILQVDGAAVRAASVRGRLIVSRSFGEPSGETLDALARYAAGRMLKEEATLAWDPVRRELILWQEIPDVLDEARIRAAFELFCMSCEWWAERCEEARVEMPEMTIRP